MGQLNPGDGGKKERTKERTKLHRRGFLHGVIGIAGAATMASTDVVSGAPTTEVNLGNEGLSPGDDITSYLEEYWNPGSKVIIPEGRYSFSGDGGAFSIDADEDSWLIGDGLVVLDNAYSGIQMRVDNGAHVRYENIEFDGQADAGIRVWTESTDSVLELVNFNIHGEPGTDRYGIYGAGDGENVGTLRFVNCTVENFDDGLYMSSPFEEHPEDGQAVVEVYGGLYRNCTSANVRVGGHNSKIISVTSVAKDIPSGISNVHPIRVREAGTNQVIKDCDLYLSDESGAADPIRVNDKRFEGDRDTSVFIEGCRIYSDCDNDYVNVGYSSTHVEGNNLHLTGSLSSADLDSCLEGSGPYNVVQGSDAEMPTLEKRFVDPDSLEPIDQSDSSDDSVSEDPGDEEVVPSEHTLAINTFSDSGINYEFSVDGVVVDGETSELGRNDSLTTEDGVATVTGTTGNGYSDDFVFDGELIDWHAERHPSNDSGEYELVLDGEVIDPSQFDDPEEGGSEETENHSPTIDQYEVTEIDSSNPHADIIVEWEVADEDGDLDSVVVEVLDSSGTLVDSQQTSIDGDTAVDVNYFQIQDVDGQTFDVETIVSDADGNAAIASATVTE